MYRRVRELNKKKFFIARRDANIQFRWPAAIFTVVTLVSPLIRKFHFYCWSLMSVHRSWPTRNCTVRCVASTKWWKVNGFAGVSLYILYFTINVTRRLITSVSSKTLTHGAMSIPLTSLIKNICHQNDGFYKWEHLNRNCFKCKHGRCRRGRGPNARKTFQKSLITLRVALSAPRPREKESS